MVIKSRKWKSIISFGAFFMGINLLVANGLPLSQELAWSARNGVPFEGLVWDYQETEGFQSWMEDYLSNFLAIAVGEEPGAFGYGGYYTGVNYTSVLVEDTMAASGESSVDAAYENAVIEAVEGGLAEGESDSGAFLDRLFGSSTTVSEAEAAYAEEDASTTYTPAQTKELTKEQKKKAADNYHESIRKDQNLLYSVSYDGQVLYTNMAGSKWKEWGDKLPDGYNFAMQYMRGHVKIEKDGEEIDVYGDGYYDGEDDWFVPGYHNFTADEALNKAQVVMFVAGEPKSYTKIKYGRGTSTQSSVLYQLCQNTRLNYMQTQRNIAGVLAGAVLCILYLFLRRGKRAADVWFGRVTGKIWFEMKLVLAAVVILPAAVYTAKISTLYIYGYWYEYADYGYGTNFYRAKILLLLFFLWMVYFAVNDIRKNPHTFWHGLVSRFMGIAETKSLTLSFSKRMVSRFLLVALVGIFAGVGAVILVALNDNGVIGVYGDEVHFLAAFFSAMVFLGVCAWYLVRMKRQAKDLDLLAAAIDAVHDGDYGGDGGKTKIEPPEDSEFAGLFAKLCDIKNGMEAAVEERTKSERMKVELIANVSHDIKTPLTSIISYIQFLKQEENLPEHVKDYIRILDEKSERLKNMVQDVFSVSKAASGQLPVELETLDFGKLLQQTLADMEENIKKSSVTIKAELPEEPVFIQADGKRLYRVFQNLIQNALLYSLDGSRVFLTLQENGMFAAASMKNTSRQELGGKDYTERFVRGDESRTDGGSGLGLSIAKSFTEACGGSFHIETIADLFVVTVEFPLAETAADKEEDK